MNGWLDVAVAVVLGLVVNECTEVSPWLAHKLVRWAAVIRQPDLVDEFAEERSATINDRPGKLFKVFTALGFLSAALVHRAAKSRPTGWPRLLGMQRVHVQAAGAASALHTVTWGVITLFLDISAVGLMVIAGSTLFCITVVLCHMPELRRDVALSSAVLPTVLISFLWIGDVPDSLLIIATMIAPVYGIAQAVRATLRDSRLLVRIGSVVTVGAVVTAEVVLLLAIGSYDAILPSLLGIVGLGVVGGMHVGVGLLVMENAVKKRLYIDLLVTRRANAWGKRQ